MEKNGGSFELKATVYVRPNADKHTVSVNNVYEDDARFFIDNGIELSFEQIDGMSNGVETKDDHEFVVYACIPSNDDEDDTNELLVLAQGRSCEDTLKELRNICEDHMNERGSQE